MARLSTFATSPRATFGQATVKESTSAPTAFELTVAPGAVFRFLLACIAFLAVMGIIVEIAKDRFDHPKLYGFATLFDLDAELTIPSYYSALTLLIAGCLLALITLTHRRRGDRWIPHWTLLTLGFVYMSVDEAAQIHELLNRPMRELLHAPGFESAWLVPVGIFVLVLAIYFLPFVLALPRRYALLFAGSGFLYVFGAAGGETIGTLFLNHYWATPFAFSAEVVVEETCEMLGVACFIYSLLDYLGYLGATFRFRPIQAGES